MVRQSLHKQSQLYVPHQSDDHKTTNGWSPKDDRHFFQSPRKIMPITITVTTAWTLHFCLTAMWPSNTSALFVSLRWWTSRHCLRQQYNWMMFHNWRCHQHHICKLQQLHCHHTRHKTMHSRISLHTRSNNHKKSVNSTKSLECICTWTHIRRMLDVTDKNSNQMMLSPGFLNGDLGYGVSDISSFSLYKFIHWVLETKAVSVIHWEVRTKRKVVENRGGKYGVYDSLMHQNSMQCSALFSYSNKHLVSKFIIQVTNAHVSK